MDTATFTATAQQWAHLFLAWVGFGTLAGLLAKAIMPGRDPGGAVATLLMGIGGTVIGLGILALVWRDMHVTPISPIGFVVATAGSFVLLFFYRLLGGRFFTESSDAGLHAGTSLRSLRRRGTTTTVYRD
ncbi:MAG: GlsB/YeaQ/YmgE family stress response membrane protein [Pirellulales bacterium]